jgi:hypothetical protein
LSGSLSWNMSRNDTLTFTTPLRRNSPPIKGVVPAPALRRFLERVGGDRGGYIKVTDRINILPIGNNVNRKDEEM